MINPERTMLWNQSLGEICRRFSTGAEQRRVDLAAFDTATAEIWRSMAAQARRAGRVGAPINFTGSDGAA